MVQDKKRSLLGKIITMDESAMSMHTPGAEQQLKQWIKKGTPDPIKA
jgi:hypothetical protein